MKDQFLQIRISPEVKKIASESSKKLGMSISEYIRFLILNDKGVKNEV